MAARFADILNHFVFEASVYRQLKDHDLITSLAFIFILTAIGFRDKATTINQLGSTDLIYFNMIGWGWFYLSTILVDFSQLTLSPGSGAL